MYAVIRKAVFLDQDQIDFLESLPGTLSENVRRTINEFKERFISFDTSASESKRKEENGRTRNN